jgi:hypothetical protein
MVDKDKLDTVLRQLIASKPMPFKDVVAQPKPKKGGGSKRSSKTEKPK